MKIMDYKVGGEKYRRTERVIFWTWILGTVLVLVGIQKVGVPSHLSFLVGILVGVLYQWTISCIHKAEVIDSLDGLIAFVQKIGKGDQREN